MKIVQINTVYGVGSTGKIAGLLREGAEERGHSVLMSHRYQQAGHRDETLPVSSWLDCHIHNRLSTITGLQGCFSVWHTLCYLRKLRKFGPDLIHLHNIHGSFINHRMLFRYIKKHHIPVVWTLHDCWSFTGGCPHFVEYGCDKWKTGCSSCPYFKQNPGTVLDTSALMWRMKHKWFVGVPDMTIVCPSKWLAGFVDKSFLREYPIKVIHNGVDLRVFRPSSGNIREKHGFSDKKIILGVAFGWNYKKGLDVFVELAKRLPDNYQIVLVGTDECIDSCLPDNIVSIHRTESQHELAELYSTADLFVNPTREDTYPTVNMEAIACGTPVLTFRTGGSPESLDETCGKVVDAQDADTLAGEIVRICEEKTLSREACLKKAEEHDRTRYVKEYLDLYERIGAGGDQGNRA